MSEKKWLCTVCGYVHAGDTPLEVCPKCKKTKEVFKLIEDTGGVQFVDGHVLGTATNADKEILDGLKEQCMKDALEAGLYLAMSRQADRDGHPEVAEAFKRYALEEAEHCAKISELIGEMVWDTKTNLEKSIDAKVTACEAKKHIATIAKQQNHDAIHDTVHEMAKDEARHGKGLEGLYNRYFK